MSEVSEADLVRRTGLTAQQRRERASRAGKGSNTVASYVKRIVRNAPDLSAEDLDALRSIVGPVTAPEIYIEGVRAGAKMAVEKIVAAAESLTGDNPLPVR